MRPVERESLHAPLAVINLIVDGELGVRERIQPCHGITDRFIDTLFTNVAGRLEHNFVRVRRTHSIGIVCIERLRRVDAASAWRAGLVPPGNGDHDAVILHTCSWRVSVAVSFAVSALGLRKDTR
jgi:hypothetical protein